MAPGPLVTIATPGRPGYICVTLGHVASALFVAHEHVAYRRVEDRVIGRQDGAPRQAENDLGVLHLQALY